MARKLSIFDSLDEIYFFITHYLFSFIMLSIIQTNVKKLLFNWKMVLVIFGVNFILVLIFARPFYNTIQNQAQQSIEFEKLTKDFDYTVISDFLHQHGESLAPFSSIAISLAVVYLLLSVFFSGGILNELDHSDGKFIVGEFLKSCTHYVGKFLLLLVFELILILVLFFAGGLFYFIFALVAEGGSEREYILWMIPPTFILFSLILIALNCVDYAKTAIYNNNSLSAWDGFWVGINFTIKNFFKTYSLLFLVLFIGLLCFLLYFGIENLIGRNSGFTIFLMFLVQQAFIFVRIFLKTLTLGNALTLYNSSELRVTSSEASEASSEEN